MGSQASKAGQAAMFSELISSQIHFSMDELHALYDRFKRLSKSNPNMQTSEFIKILEGSVFEPGSPFIKRMVEVLDEDRNGEIDFREFVSFRCFDLDGNGGISNDEMRQVLTALTKTVHGTTRELIERGLAGPHPAEPTGAEIDRFIEDAFTEFDANRDGLLQRDEYRAACASHPFMLAAFKAAPAHRSAEHHTAAVPASPTLPHASTAAAAATATATAADASQQALPL